MGALPVLDADRLAGIVTDRDLVAPGLARELAPDTRMDVMMTASVLAVDEDSDVAIVYCSVPTLYVGYL